MPQSLSAEVDPDDSFAGSSLDSVISKYRKNVLTIIIGMILIGVGVIIYRYPNFFKTSKVEILEQEGAKESLASETVGVSIIVEIAGFVEKPGVYSLPVGSRIDDLLVVSGGVTQNADRDYVSKYVNRASKLTDGQKLYIPGKTESGDVRGAGGSSESAVFENPGGLININTATQKELEDLPGIGPVYAQSIIEHRVYSTISELLSKGALKSSVYEKLKGRVTVN